jgi:charged multivesicular body protein 7
MMKRKPTEELDGADGPNASSSLFRDAPPLRARKRLFRLGDRNTHSWKPKKERAMPELLDFILQHEDAFKKYSASRHTTLGRTR